MLILSKTALQFEGDDGENITVDVTAQNTVFLVTFVLDGAAEQNLNDGDQIQFTLSKNSAPSILMLQLGFQPKDGTGAYAVTVSGDQGGLTFSQSFGPKFGVDVLVKPFTFQVSGV
jgi:hypothetical protein